MSNRPTMREALQAAREFASGWQYAGKQGDEAQELVRLVDEALAADDAARGTMREEFEAWALQEHLVMTTELDVAQICGQPLPPVDGYVDRATRAAWSAWQSAPSYATSLKRAEVERLVRGERA